jgi:hypothetical protein
MKILTSKAHGFIDYVTVVFLVLSPSLFHMSSPAKQITYTLAFVHLCLTLLTRFELGVFRVIPLWLHGVIELCVSLALITATLFLITWNDKTSFYFYTSFSVLLFIVWLISDYAFPAVKRKQFTVKDKIQKL